MDHVFLCQNSQDVETLKARGHDALLWDEAFVLQDRPEVHSATLICTTAKPVDLARGVTLAKQLLEEGLDVLVNFLGQDVATWIQAAENQARTAYGAEGFQIGAEHLEGLPVKPFDYIFAVTAQKALDEIDPQERKRLSVPALRWAKLWWEPTIQRPSEWTNFKKAAVRAFGIRARRADQITGAIQSTSDVHQWLEKFCSYRQRRDYSGAWTPKAQCYAHFSIWARKEGLPYWSMTSFNRKLGPLLGRGRQDTRLWPLTIQNVPRIHRPNHCKLRKPKKKWAAV